jgi:hypothetical protein
MVDDREACVADTKQEVCVLVGYIEDVAVVFPHVPK